MDRGSAWSGVYGNAVVACTRNNLGIRGFVFKTVSTEQSFESFTPQNNDENCGMADEFSGFASCFGSYLVDCSQSVNLERVSNFNDRFLSVLSDLIVVPFISSL